MAATTRCTTSQNPHVDHAPADGRLRAAHPGEQAARVVGTRRGRRVRIENLSLRRRGDRLLGRLRQGAQAGEVDRRAATQKASCRTRTDATMSRPCVEESAIDKATGTFLGLRVHTLPIWAVVTSGPPSRPACPPISTTHAAGRCLQDAGDLTCEVKAIFTNTVAVDAYRGAGRLEATFLLERPWWTVAHDTGMYRPGGTAPP